MYGTPSTSKVSDKPPQLENPGTRTSSLQKEDLDDASCMSIKSGVEGPYARGADTPLTEPSVSSFADSGDK